MARITARQAYTRTRSKRDNSSSQASNKRADATSEFARRVGSSKAPASESSYTSKYEDDAYKPAKIRLVRSKVARHTIDNKKITDYFSVLSRGRENIPKSPQQPIMQIAQAGPKRACTNSDLKTHSQSFSGLNIDVKYFDKNTPAVYAHQEHTDEEDDIEILDILPPIPQRDHKVVLIEDE